jgi:hypothetical protein
MQAEASEAGQAGEMMPTEIAMAVRWAVLFPDKTLEELGV